MGKWQAFMFASSSIDILQEGTFLQSGSLVRYIPNNLRTTAADRLLSVARAENDRGCVKTFWSWFDGQKQSENPVSTQISAPQLHQVRADFT